MSIGSSGQTSLPVLRRPSTAERIGAALVFGQKDRLATSDPSSKGKAANDEREPHVVEEKEPDIRLQASGGDASLPIEIKVAESWSLSELEKALKVQLGGRYLRAKDAKHGILLLVHKERHTWDGPAGEKWKLPEVVEHLCAIADATASGGQTEPQAKIAVIDVTDVVIPARVTNSRPQRPRSLGPV